MGRKYEKGFCLLLGPGGNLLFTSGSFTLRTIVRFILDLFT